MDSVGLRKYDVASTDVHGVEKVNRRQFADIFTIMCMLLSLYAKFRHFN